MTSSYQLVVFDWEGTIADTLGQILHTVSTVAQEHGFGPIDFDLARNSVNLGLVKALQRVLPNLSTSEQEILLQAVQKALMTHPTHVYLIPGVLDLIKALHKANISLAIATNKGHHSLTKALASSGLDAFFKVTRSAGFVPAKPCPQMLEEIMQEFGATSASTLMIGDSPTDMEMAHSIQVAAIGLDFYHQQEAALKKAGAMAVFDDYHQLANFLNLPMDGSEKR